MVEVFSAYFTQILNFFQIPLVIYGYTFTIWDVFLFSLFASILFGFVGRLLS